MNWQALSALAEAVAAVGVILSLIYVGAQVRQGTIEARVGLLRTMVNELGRVHDSLAQNADLAEIVVRGFADYEALSVVERARLSSYLAHMFKLFEQLYVLHGARAIEPADWRGFENAMADLASYPGVQAWWATRRHWSREDFDAFLGRLTADRTGGNIYREREAGRPAPTRPAN